MRKQSFILLFLPLVALLLTAFLAFNQAQAGIEHNIRGLASSSQGYISFNCLDDDFFGKFPMIFPFYFNVTACSVSQHGVHLDVNNNFSGSAWSPSLGFIYFDSIDPAIPDPSDYSFNVDCPNLCNAANNCLACYNEITQRVYGWAYRNAAGGQWIDLDSESPPVTMTNFSNPQPGVFSGYANSPFNQISFNCLTDNTCGINDYKVYMWKLELQEMSAPNWSFAQACSTGARRVVLEWVRKSGTQTAYRVVVNTSNSTSSVVFDSGKLSGSATQLVCPGANCGAWVPNYSTSYYWWLQLWNEADEPTELFQFNRDTYGVLTDNIDHNDAVSSAPRLTFTTYKHEFPNPLFIIPPEILVGTTTYFTSDSSYYTTINPDSNPQPCLDGGACDFLWSVSNPATATIEDPTAHTASTTFSDTLPQTVTLAVTDPDNYICSFSSPVLSINFQLPIWREVKAE